ncbi:hypothetical protein VIGAN_11201800, partial [Vigna angularis var. angularis]
TVSYFHNWYRKFFFFILVKATVSIIILRHSSHECRAKPRTLPVLLHNPLLPPRLLSSHALLPVRCDCLKPEAWRYLAAIVKVVVGLGATSLLLPLHRNGFLLPRQNHNPL